MSIYYTCKRARRRTAAGSGLLKRLWWKVTEFAVSAAAPHGGRRAGAAGGPKGRGIDSLPEHLDIFLRELLSLHNIFFHFEAFVHKSILVVLPTPLALPTPFQYYCTDIAQTTTLRPKPLLYAIHHTILAITISCKSQGAPLRLPEPLSDPFPMRVCSCPLCIKPVCAVKAWPDSVYSMGYT